MLLPRHLFARRRFQDAARTTDAAASLSPDRTVFSCFLSCKSQCFCTYSSRLTVLSTHTVVSFCSMLAETTFLEFKLRARRRAAGPRSAPEALAPSPTPLLHLAHSGGALQARVRGSRRGVSAEVSELG